MAFTDIVFSESYARGIWEIPIGTAPGTPVAPGLSIVEVLADLYARATPGTPAVVAAAVWDEILTGATHNIASSAGRRLRQIQAGADAFSGTINGTPPDASNFTLDNTASTTADFYIPGLVVVESSFGVQFRRISAYSAGRVVTVATPFTTIPASGDGVSIIPWASVRVSDVDANAIDAASIAADAVTEIQAGLAVPGDAMTLEAGERIAIADALLDLVDGIEDGVTLREAVKAMAAVLAGESSGSDATGGHPIYDAAGNPGTPRVEGDTDEFGNRSDVVIH